MTFLTKKHISRRTLLRGAGISLALPMLDSMVPARAAAPTSPPRFVGIFNPHGWAPEYSAIQQAGSQSEGAGHAQAGEGQPSGRGNSRGGQAEPNPSRHGSLTPKRIPGRHSRDRAAASERGEVHRCVTRRAGSLRNAGVLRRTPQTDV